MATPYLTLGRLLQALVTMFALYIMRFIYRVYTIRRRFRYLRGPEGHSWIFGHLKIMSDIIKGVPPLLAPQYFPHLIKEKHNLPDVFYLDIYPAGPPALIICSPEVCRQVMVEVSMPKHPVVGGFVKNFGGPGNLVSSEGAEWKKWRAAFNPGFSASHLMQLVPLIVEETEIFCQVLAEKAEKGERFLMEGVTTRLTIDIISRITLDHKLGSQRQSNELADAFISQIEWQSKGMVSRPIEIIDWPIRMLVQRYNSYRMDRYIGRHLDNRFATWSKREKSKAVIDLALDTYLKEKGVPSSSAGGLRTDPEFRAAAINNMKIFVFAGHDTTSATICYIFYYLSKHPVILARARKELDDIFGPAIDPEVVGKKICDAPHLLNRLEYALAIIREVLRLQPPASSIRAGRKGHFITDPSTGERLETEGCMLWCNNIGVQHNSKYWPDPHKFDPDRFLHSATSDDSANFRSNDAWIAFSKGPRNCIGQELAVIETKVIMSIMLRKFDFQELYAELDGAEGKWTMWGEVAYQEFKGAAKPRGGMPCRVSMRT